MTDEERQHADGVMLTEREHAKGHGHDLGDPVGLAFSCKECGASFAVLGLDRPGPWTVFQHSALGKPCVKSRRAIQVGA